MTEAHRTEDRRNLPKLLREAERRVNARVFRTGGDDALASIPANRDRDVDLLLMEAADTIEAMASIGIRQETEIDRLKAELKEARRCKHTNRNGTGSISSDGKIVTSSLYCADCGEKLT